MRIVAYLLRTQRGWLRSWLGLSLLLAVVGGAVLAVGAGARRTDSAYPRFLASSNLSDVFVGGNDIEAVGDPDATLHRIATLPQVAEAAPAYFLLTAISTSSGRLLTIDTVSPIATTGRRFRSAIDRFKVLDGRLAAPERADEVDISFPLADTLGLHVGDSLIVRPLRLDAFTVGQPPANGIISRDRVPLNPKVTSRVRIAGIVASPVRADFPPLPPPQLGSVYFTPGYVQQNAGRVGAFPAMAIRLRHGTADLAAFRSAAEQIGASQQVEIDIPDEHRATVQSTVHLQAVGLGVLAALAALILLLVLGQGAARRIALGAGDHLALRALGATRPQLFAAAVARTGIAAFAGAAGAAIVALALSPLSPRGLAGDAEPAPGVDLDPAVVLGGAAVLVLLVLLLAALPAWQAAGADVDVAGPQRRWRLADALARVSFPASAVTGVRLALERGRGRRAVPVRSAIVACVVGTATVAGALTFGASLDHLLATPQLYGWNWDAVVGNSVFADHAARTIADRPWVAADAAGTGAIIGVDGDRATGLGMDSVKGSIGPVLSSGRVPRAGDEILLGAQTDPGARIGQLVRVHVGDTSMPMRLVGRGVLPVISDTSRLGIGAWLPFSALRRLLGPDGAQYDTLFVRFSGDPAAARAQLTRLFGVNGVQLPDKPSGLVGFGDLSALPAVLGGVLAAGAVATLAHAVATSVRNRRRELAVLKTLGFVRRQVAAAVAWQTSTIALAAAVVGVPLGVAAGRWAWTVFASQQGVVSDPVIPVVTTLLLLPAALLLANLVAAIPGRFAARTSPALVLRAE